MSNILTELKRTYAGLEGTAVVEEVKPYAGHAFESELTEIDEILGTFDLEEGCEGYALVEAALIVAAATEENGAVNLAGLEAVGTSQLAEKVKQAGYKARAYANKIIDAVLKFIKNLVNVIMNKNVALKKFGKLIKKYNATLIKKQFGEKADGKEITIRDFSNLEALVGETKKLTKTDIDAETTKVKDASDWDAFFAALKAALAKVSGLAAGDFKDIDAVTAILEDDKIKTRFEDVIEANEVKETLTVSYSEAKRALVKVATRIEATLDTDIKIQAQMRKLMKEVEKKRKNIFKATTETEDMAKDNLVVNKAALVVTKSQAGYTKLFKHTSNALNALLTDMYKVNSL